MREVEINAEAVERLARQHDLSRFTMGMRAPEHDMTAATLRALRAALDAAEMDLAIARADLDNSGATSVEIAAERDAALAARDGAQKALRTAAGLANEMSWKPSTRAFADRLVNIIREGFAASRALQPPADLAAEAPGDAVLDVLRDVLALAEAGHDAQMAAQGHTGRPWPDEIVAARNILRARAGA
jgi:hypothetical protein